MCESNPDPLAGLTEEEVNSFQHLINRLEDEYDQEDLLTIRERLAASRASDARKRALLEKFEWVRHDDEDSEYGEIWICPDCCEVKRDGHHPDCALAAELEGGE